MLRLENKGAGCFLRLPHCSLQTTRKWQVCVWFLCKCFLCKHGLVKCLPSPCDGSATYASTASSCWLSAHRTVQLCLELGRFSSRICSSLKEDSSQECSQLSQASPIKVQEQGCPEGRGIALCLTLFQKYDSWKEGRRLSEP